MTSPQAYGYLLERQKELLKAVNSASVGARTTWLFYLALMAYFFIAVASVTHQNLLLNTPVQLPFFGIGINVTHFFLFAPVVFLLIQLGMLVQHIALHRKVCRFSQKLRVMEDTELPAGEEYRHEDADWLRYQVSSYFYTQRYSGSLKRTAIQALIILMYQVSFLLLPVVLLLFFQAKFIPYHDEAITWWTRVYVVVGVIMLVGMRLITLGYESQTRRHNFQLKMLRAVSLSVGFAFSVTAILASTLVFTIPDSKIDCATRLVFGQLYRTAYKDPTVKPIDVGWFEFVISPFDTITKNDKYLAKCRAGKTRRSALPLTEYLTKRRYDPQSGRQVNYFERNLYVTDQEIVKSSIAINDGVVGVDNDSISLRNRNLRYATLDRSILKGADLTGVDLKWASLRGTNMQGAKLTCDNQIKEMAIAAAKQRKKDGQASDQNINLKFVSCANLEGADLAGAFLIGADLRGANFRLAKMNGAMLTNALAISTDFTQAELSFANFDNANMPRAIFTYANMTEASLNNAKLRFAQFTGTILSRAKMRGAIFVLANLTGAHLKRADLQEAILTHAQLPGANLYGANFTKADLSFAAMEGADLRLAQLKNAKLTGTQLAGVRATAAKFHCSDFKNTNLQGADLRGAIFYGSKFDKTTNIDLSDLRFAHIWQSKPPSRARLVDFTNTSTNAPADNILLSLRQDICRMRDYHINPGKWRNRRQARIDKVEKCVTLAKASAGQSLEEFTALVAKQDQGRLYRSGIPYNCSYLEAGLKEATSPAVLQPTTSAVLQPTTSFGWRGVGAGQSGAPLSTINSKLLSEELAKLICTEKPYASFIAEGVTRRITERIPDMNQNSAPNNEPNNINWLNFQGDAETFLSTMTGKENCAKIAKKMRHSLFWQLQLAVKINRQEKASRDLPAKAAIGAIP